MRLSIQAGTENQDFIEHVSFRFYLTIIELFGVEFRALEI